MKHYRAYKTELDPNYAQVRKLRQHAGAARWAFNFALQQKQAAYASYVAAGKPDLKGKRATPSAIDLHREIVKLKHTPERAWLNEVSKCAPQEALRNADTAYANFFRRCKQGAKKKGFPRKKTRKHGLGSFTLRGAIHAFECSIQLPNLGVLRLKEANYLPSAGIKIRCATVSEKSGRWYVSLQTGEDLTYPLPPSHVLGVDVGIHQLATTSDGEVFENPRATRRYAARLCLLQQSVSRKKKGSVNRRKAQQRVAKLHHRICCIRRDATHKATTAISKQASVVVVESLNVAGMVKNRKLAKAVSDANLAEFHRQLEYKVKWRGGTLVKADPFYPSSKTCSQCSAVKVDLSLSERVYSCAACGLQIDRDLNAALNLKGLAASSAVSACRPGSAGRSRKTSVKLLVGQEPRSFDSVGIEG